MASLRAKGLGILLVPTIGLLAVAIALVLVQRQEREAEQVALHAGAVRVTTQRILALLVDAETGVRGFVATGDETFLEPYRNARRELPPAFDELHRLEEDVADDPPDLEPLADQALAELAELQRVRDDPAARLDAARQGKATMDELRSRVAAAIEEHEEIRRREQQHSDDLEDTAWAISFAVVALGFLGGTGLNGLFFSRVVHRLSNAQANANRLAAGEPLVDGTDADDELGALSHSLRDAAAVIAGERARLALALGMGRITVFEIGSDLRIRDQRGEPLVGEGTIADALAVVVPEDRERALAALQIVRDGGPTQDFTLRLVDDAGWMAGRIARVRLGEGEGGGEGDATILGVSMDISEVRRTEEALREAERRLAAEHLRRTEEQGRHNALLLASAGEGIYSVDANGVCTSINPAGARMLGYEVADLVGVDMHATIHYARPDTTPYPASECPVIGSMATGEGVRGDDEVYWRSDGRRLPVQFSSFPLIDEDVVRGAVVTFTDVIERQRAREELEAASAELRAGIAAGQLVLHYQPKIELSSGACEAVEALVRWQRGDCLVFPDDFIPLAERTGVVELLTTWVLEEAFRQAAAWRSSGLGLRVAVNLSAQSLKDETITERIATTAGAIGVPASCVEVEMTETTLVEDTDSVLLNLAHFKAMGVRSAIDDFGTGFSSLSYLKHLPVDYIKIDKSFVMNMPRDTRDQAIVSSTIHLAHSLGIRVVAEGVEDDLVMRLLQIAGCDIGQGYHWTKPVPADQVERWLSNRR